ncbi:hypothetical protein OSCI_3480001 [Kamptonema sp. PCC 6506]|uniref:hypothetical protein n=1 Tax=Kamptonema formosum TaxID=331992 RepID=UPI0001DACDFF|nr:hypothetical protein [Kamptonema formosum]CBN57594.1 hypothetical protein OSCI_3480001 [Kamptonema sp. PCC 6506]
MIQQRRISDRSTYYIRLFNHQGKLLAFSPSQILRVPQANPEDTQTMLYKVEKQGRHSLLTIHLPFDISKTQPPFPGQK